MPRVGVKELKNRTTQIVRDVRERSQRYVITLDGTPVAVLKPYSAAEDERPTAEEFEAWLKEWDELVEEIGKHLPPGASGVDAVAEQRR
jgi:prevent-host-death family protein